MESLAVSRSNVYILVNTLLDPWSDKDPKQKSILPEQHYLIKLLLLISLIRHTLNVFETVYLYTKCLVTLSAFQDSCCPRSALLCGSVKLLANNNPHKKKVNIPFHVYLM